MDEFQYELAERITDADRERAIEQNRLALGPQHHPDSDGVHCIDCGAEMAPERQASRRIRCTDCQTIKEEQDKRFARH